MVQEEGASRAPLYRGGHARLTVVVGQGRAGADKGQSASSPSWQRSGRDGSRTDTGMGCVAEHAFDQRSVGLPVGGVDSRLLDMPCTRFGTSMGGGPVSTRPGCVPWASEQGQHDWKDERWPQVGSATSYGMSFTRSST